MKKMVLLIAMLMPATLWADGWQLDSAQSDINFVSVKKGKVAEVHHFSGLNGSIHKGSATVAIDLSTIESGITIRNERMKSMLFDIARFPSAQISVDLSSLDIEKLQAGAVMSVELPFSLNLHGVKRELKAQVQVTSLADDGLQVTSRQPVIIKAADFELDAGLEALRQIASLTSIAQVVPVSFYLRFKR